MTDKLDKNIKNLDNGDSNFLNRSIPLAISAILVIFVYFTLNQEVKDYESMYDEALTYMENKEFRECNVLLNDIIDSTESSFELKNKSIFKLGEIYNFLKNYSQSISYFKQLLVLETENPLRKNALFMVAYIQNNKMDMYTESILTYEQFKRDYPDDELIPSVDYEIQQIEKLISNAKNQEIN